MKRSILFVILFINYIICWGQSYPEGFNEEVAYDQFDSPAGILHTVEDISIVWELSGKVWTISNGEISDGPVIDISEEVAYWGDLGMIGAVLHPDFLDNGYIYLLYSVDRHYLLNYGTPDYDPTFSETGVPSLGRLTRYQLNTIDFQFAIPDSRQVLLGENSNDGLPICTPSHGTGALLFGEDGSLLVSTGDGNTWVRSSSGMGYNGQGSLPEYAYDSLALSDGILKPEEFLGGFRSQYLDGLNGKILRIHPETGEGLANNPFYNQAFPDSPRSKIWSLGLRNPYRMTIKPGTGFGNLNEGFPGVIYIADVGDWIFEEINVVNEPGLNFGWPMYQGPTQHDLYYLVPTANSNAPNSLFGEGNCNNEFMNYQEIITQPNEFHNYFFSNPCNPSIEISDEVITFEHERPVLSYANSANEQYPFAVVPAWDDDGEPTFYKVDDAISGVSGDSFTGISGSGGVFLKSDSIPQEYRGLYIQGDFSGWLRAFEFDETHELKSIELWNEFIGAPIHLSENPSDGCLYVTSIYPPEIKRICFGGNLKPVISVSPEVVYGIGELEINFDASQSYDPEGQPLTFEWDFGDGSIGNGSQISHTYTPNGSEMENFQTTLVVTDPEGASSEQVIPVSLNNTPPTAEITSINEGEFYAIDAPTLMNLIAESNDAESGEEELDFNWQLLLHHNTHFHYMEVVEGNNQTYLLSPTGCSEDETYWYEYVLTVTDPGGLFDTDSVEIFPDCEGTLQDHSFDDPLIVYPNPVTTNRVNVLSQKDLGSQVNYVIYNSLGGFVEGGIKQINNQRKYFALTLPQLVDGVYFLRFEIKGEYHSIRIVVFQE
jgi:glucose/arabinose dehydrogenase